MDQATALKGAIEMLRHIAKGGSYDPITFYERLHAYEKAAAPPAPEPKETPRRVEERGPRPAGYYSNSIITARNGGVPHQFADSIGGCSSNYR